MRHGSRHLLILCVIAASCSNRVPTPSSASLTPNFANGSDGSVGGSAVGDVKVGTGALDFDSLRLDRQTTAGVSLIRQYAEPGKVYRMELGETIELWAEWDRNVGKVPNTIPSNPRLVVDWGAGKANSPDFINCGSCLIKHTYARRGLYTVVAKLDDRVSTSVTRTFFLDSRDASPSASPTPTASVTPTPCCTIRGSASDVSASSCCG